MPSCTIRTSTKAPISFDGLASNPSQVILGRFALNGLPEVAPAPVVSSWVGMSTNGYLAEAPLAPAEILMPSGAPAPRSWLRDATLLDEPEQFPNYFYATAMHDIAHATVKLDASALSRLIGYVEQVGEPAGVVASSRGVYSANADLTKRAWFRTWAVPSLPFAVANAAARERLLEVLRAARRAQRRLPRPKLRVVDAVRRLHSQLERLSNFIAPNAPPLPLLAHVPAGVGVH